MKPLSIYLFMAVALGTLVFCCVSAKATDCMVGYWRLDEGDGEKAYDSVNDNDGTIYGASWTTGMVGQALNFDGTSNYVDLGNGTELTNLTPAGMAVEAWVYNARTLQSSGVDVRVVLAQRDDYNNGGGNGYGLQYGYVKGYDIDAYFCKHCILRRSAGNDQRR